MKSIFLAVVLLLISSCRQVELRRDLNPSPVDVAIEQARLEFSGCGYESSVGAVACRTGDEVSIRTEFSGTVTYFSTGLECSLFRTVEATPPLTKIQFTGVKGTICTVSAVYLPRYPRSGSSRFPIYSLKGDAIFLADERYQPLPTQYLTDIETLRVPFEGALSGAFVTRQSNEVFRFNDVLEWKPLKVGQDLILARIQYPDSRVSFFAIPANYYSFRAVPISLEVLGGGKLAFDNSVSIVTVNGKVFNVVNLVISNRFTGYVRAYTVQGRTLVSYWQNGELVWKL